MENITAKVMISLLFCITITSFVSNLGILVFYSWLNAHKYLDPQNSLWINSTLLLAPHWWVKVFDMFILNLYESCVTNFRKLHFDGDTE